MTVRWRGRGAVPAEQVANADDSFVDLAPVSGGPAAATRSAWAAWLPGTDPVPLIWEK